MTFIPVVILNLSMVSLFLPCHYTEPSPAPLPAAHSLYAWTSQALSDPDCGPLPTCSSSAHLQLFYFTVSPLQLQSAEAFVESVHEGTFGDRVHGEGTQESRAPFLLRVPIFGQFK